MRRREFIGLFSGAAVASALRPRPVRAQQAAVPTIGFLSLRSASETVQLVAAFREGLAEAGFVEGRNVAMVFRWADGSYDRLRPLASELVSLGVAAIATSGGAGAALAAKTATNTVPVVFTGSSDPVAIGLVASLSRPGGNVTGALNIASELTAKRLDLLRELQPAASTFGVIRNPASPEAAAQLRDTEEAARLLGKQVLMATARTALKFETAVASLAGQ